MFGLVFPKAVLDTDFAFERIVTLRCDRCETLYYFPSVLGSPSYYDFLSSNLSWYYDRNRWEYSISIDVLDREDCHLFLEIGCGDGAFLRLARERGRMGHGYEIAPQSIAALRSQGFQLLDDANTDSTSYDAVAMFQVLEHLADPFAVLSSLVARIRPGGLILLSTPVTPSCVTLSRCAFALPPHHQWLPTVSAYAFLAERLGLNYEQILLDPPSMFQVEYAWRKFLPTRLTPGRLLPWVSYVTWRLAFALRRPWSKVGHTALAILRKPEIKE